MCHPEYARESLPHLKVEYFNDIDKLTGMIFDVCAKHWYKYDVQPSPEVLISTLEQIQNVSDEEYVELTTLLDGYTGAEKENLDWLKDETEKWIKHKAIEIAITKSINILDNDKDDNGIIPELLIDALSVTMQQPIGHDYINDAVERFNFYKDVTERIPFRLEKMNEITGGGVKKATLNIILGSTNVGKTMTLVDFTSSYLLQGFNVLYISMEMAEKEIAQRIDANLFDIDINEIEDISELNFNKAIKSIKDRTNGRLKIVQYPTGEGDTLQFRSLVRDLSVKEDFKVDIIMVDYLGICSSSRMSSGTAPHILIKSIAEELRGLAVNLGVPLWTAHQLNRNGLNNSDPDLSDIADSYSLASVADFIIMVIRTEELDAVNKLSIKQVKSRYGNKGDTPSIVVNVDPNKQKLSDSGNKTQSYVSGSTNDKMVKNPNAPIRKARRLTNKK